MKFNGSNSPLFNLFDFDRFPPSIANLPAAMTINNITVYPTFRYNGKDATSTVWNPWGYGQQLTLQAGTAPTYNNGSPLLGSLDDSVLFNGDGYYADTSGTTFGNVSTNDVVGEIIFKTIDSKVLFAKRAAAIGYVIGIDATPALYITIQDASGSVTVTSAALTSTAINHATFYLDRSGSGQIYINGAVSGSAVAISTRALTISAAIALTIGADGADANQYTSNLHYLSLWQSASWLDSHLQPIIAKTRFMQLTGMYPQQARGTALPTTYTRNLASYIDKIESDGTTKLYYVGANWPRVCSRIDSAGKTIKGYLEEGSTVNLLKYSSDFSNWLSPVNLTITANGEVSPLGTVSSLFTESTDGGDVEHGVSCAGASSISLTGGTKYVAQILAKLVSGGRTTFSLRVDALGGNLAQSVFDLSTGTVTSTAAYSTFSIIAYGVKSMGNGWYNFWYSFSTSTTQTTYIRIYMPTALTGNGRQDWYVAFVGVESGAYPTSYIPTTTAAVTRSADVLTFVGNDGNTLAGQGTLVYDILLPSYDVTTDGYAVTLSNAASATVNIKSGINATNDSSCLLINNTTRQATIVGTTDISSNTVKTITNTWNTNSAILQVNSTQEGTPSTTCTIPTITQIDLSDEAGANQINGLIANLKIYNTDNANKKG